MATAKEQGGVAKPRGRQAEEPAGSLPDKVTHLEFARKLNVSSQVFRRWANATPPKVPRPDFAIGSLWFYDRERVRRYLLTGEWGG